MFCYLKPLWGAALAVIIVAAGAGFCQAGAWTAEKGESYNRFALSSFYSDQNYDQDGDKKGAPSDADFRDLNLNYYLEYGVTDEATVIASLYLKYLSREDDFRKDETWGIGDIDLGLKYQLWERPGAAVSTQGLVKIPEAYDDREVLPLGDGVYDLELRLLYGQSLWRFFPGYCNFEAAYRWREGSADGQLRYLVELGSDFGKNFYGRIKLDGIEGMGDDTDVLDPEGNPSATTDFDLGKLDLALGYEIDPRWGLEVAYTPTIYGENTAAGATWGLAVTFKP